MKLLLDQKSLQVCAHFGGHPKGDGFAPSSRNVRLGEALRIAEKVGFTDVEVSSGKSDQFNALNPDDIKTVAILTRLQVCLFSSSELDDLCEFLSNGGSVLLMSNHPKFDRNDSALTKRFNIDLGGCVDSPVDPGDGFVHINTEVNASEVFGTEPLEIVFNNCCNVFPKESQAKIAANLPPQGEGVFAAYLDSIGAGGRFFICGNSGFLGNCGTNRPGPGLICRGQNSLFFECILKWLSNCSG